MKGSGEILNKLFGSPYRVKILRFFISNPNDSFYFKDLPPRLQLANHIIRREFLVLSKINFLKSSKRDKNEKWFLNHSFLFLKPLRNLILSASPISSNELIEKIKKAGRLKFVVLSGALIEEENDSKIDVLVIGDNLNRSSFNKILKNIEAEVGKELSFVLMPVKEFLYRVDIRDKFVREILESPHEIILDKLKIF